MNESKAPAQRREGRIALIAGSGGPQLAEPDEQELESVEPDISRELDLAIAVACAQRSAAPIDITHQVVAQTIATQPMAFGFEGEGQQCRGCGCGDLHSCWPPCWWVERDLCSRCAQAGLDEVRADVAEGPACTSTESADGTFVDRCARAEARANDIDEAVAAWHAGDGEMEIHEAPGMTAEDYAFRVERRTGAKPMTECYSCGEPVDTETAGTIHVRGAEGAYVHRTRERAGPRRTNARRRIGVPWCTPLRGIDTMRKGSWADAAMLYPRGCEARPEREAMAARFRAGMRERADAAVPAQHDIADWETFATFLDEMLFRFAPAVAGAEAETWPERAAPAE